MTTVSEISMELVRELPNLRDALRACALFSGKPLKEIAFHLEIDTGHLSKMLNPTSDPRHFPPQKIPLLMDICGNEIPLLWLMQARGYPDPRQIRLLEREVQDLSGDLVKTKDDAKVLVNIFKTFQVPK